MLEWKHHRGGEVNHMSEVIVTRHGEKRIRKRLGVNKKCANRTAAKAMTLGVTHAEATGKLSRYLDGVYLPYRSANNMRVYNRAVYLFSGDILITVLALPKKYHDLADKLQRQKAVN